MNDYEYRVVVMVPEKGEWLAVGLPTWQAGAVDHRIRRYMAQDKRAEQSFQYRAERRMVGSPASAWEPVETIGQEKAQ